MTSRLRNGCISQTEEPAIGEDGARVGDQNDVRGLDGDVTSDHRRPIGDGQAVGGTGLPGKSQLNGVGHDQNGAGTVHEDRVSRRERADGQRGGEHGA